MKLITKDDDFKFNCAVIVLDFLIRHGYVTPDTGAFLTTFLRYVRVHTCEIAHFETFGQKTAV